MLSCDTHHMALIHRGPLFGTARDLLSALPRLLLNQNNIGFSLKRIGFSMRYVWVAEWFCNAHLWVPPHASAPTNSDTINCNIFQQVRRIPVLHLGLLCAAATPPETALTSPAETLTEAF